MQRTAIARALVHRPKVLLADEPTGNLDAANADKVLEIFRRIADERLTTLIVVTHSDRGRRNSGTTHSFEERKDCGTGGAFSVRVQRLTLYA